MPYFEAYARLHCCRLLRSQSNTNQFLKYVLNSFGEYRHYIVFNYKVFTLRAWKKERYNSHFTLDYICNYDVLGGEGVHNIIHGHHKSLQRTWFSMKLQDNVLSTWSMSSTIFWTSITHRLCIYWIMCPTKNKEGYQT